MASRFAIIFGAFLGLTLVKFGNPPIMEKWVVTPSSMLELVFDCPWPIHWAYWMLALVCILGLACARPNRSSPAWLLALPLCWLIWQILASFYSVDGSLTQLTMRHFVACVICYYLGAFALSRVDDLLPFWIGLIVGFLVVIFVGWQQHFGGLAETRSYFLQYLYPKMPNVSPEYLKKISSNRIFSTLFYPNALAGAVLLLLPVTVTSVLAMKRWFARDARIFLACCLAIGGLGCLYWSGSKGGWLLALLLGMLVLARLPFSRNIKLLIVSCLLAAGLLGFFWKYSTFFQKGATSVSARFDYWRAAVYTVKERPVWGSGPGTFAISYLKVKKPESEMARLVHNDYLQQASDSGLAGWLLYTAFIAFGLFTSYTRTQDSALRFAMWVGLLGWAVQSFVEFGLYIPSLAWPVFACIGWFQGKPRS